MSCAKALQLALILTSYALRRDRSGINSSTNTICCLQRVPHGGLPPIHALKGAPSQLRLQISTRSAAGVARSNYVGSTEPPVRRCAQYPSALIIKFRPPSRLQSLLAVKGISDAKLEKLMEACKKMQNVGFMSGTEALLKQKVRGSRSVHWTSSCAHSVQVCCC